MITQTDYRDVLKSELSRRRAQNSSYSQAAFARDLKISSSRLNEVLKGKQGLSAKVANTIGFQLGYTVRDQNYFTDLCRAKHSRDKLERVEAENRVLKYREALNYSKIDPDSFKVISDWYHLAIVELLKNIDFEHSTSWIANRLNISTEETIDAIDRLKRVGLIKVVNNKLVATNADNCFPGGIPSKHVKKFHSQILKKALVALEAQPVEKRDFSSTMLSIDSNKLPLLKARIAEFWKEMDIEATPSASRNAVYCLGIQLFSITDIKGKL